MNSKPFIVAELSANHNGSLDRALKIIEAAADAGADAVKFQTFIPEEMVLDHEYVVESGQWAGRKLIDLYREAHTPRGWHPKLFEHARSLGLVAFSSPFSKSDVDFLETLDCPIYKIASFEAVDLEFVRYVDSKGKPMIISTGQVDKDELLELMSVVCGDVTLLKCTSEYPADASLANLAGMVQIGKCGFDVGISDHSLGIGVAVAAVALGATAVEKHLTISRADGGLDASFSMEPDEFAQMVVECRRAANAIGAGFRCKSDLEPSNTHLRRSLWYANDLPEGHVVTKEDLVTARPNLGINPIRLNGLIGQKLTRSVEANTPAREEDLCKNQ